MQKIRSVSFDLDGTLLDTVPDLGLACNQMLADLDEEPYDMPSISTFVGQGVGHLVERCLSRNGPPSPERLADGLDRFRTYYAEVNGKGSVFYPGVQEGLVEWQALNLPMAVVTNKPGTFTLPLLERMGLHDIFSVVVSGDTVINKKPHPEPILHACCELGNEAAEYHLHIGDSQHDIAAAHAAGCSVWCVPYGYHGGKVPCADDCDELVPDLLSAARLAASSR